ERSGDGALDRLPTTVETPNSCATGPQNPKRRGASIPSLPAAPKRCRAVPPLNTRSWSQSVRQAKGGPTHESPIPVAIPLCMKKYSVRRVGLGARNLFRSGGGRTEVRAPDGIRRCRSEASVPYRRLGVSESTVDSHFRGNRPFVLVVVLVLVSTSSGWPGFEDGADEPDDPG